MAKIYVSSREDLFQMEEESPSHALYVCVPGSSPALGFSLRITFLFLPVIQAQEESP